ncbi:dockerin type I domain-containing protein [Hominilimicola fabiformis]|uniref:Dockerin type I domain-containing protein n=1 Tax=Hominilimicola fabiformis TaxID=2885356 RepID=A0AAE3E0C4_9FIRM|nr:dockerin type I domain-containing protein [Hominilimicola fabiformis]MCC2211249.1 dockerin type I domain-containing protein [Hominilimicola fabiformis]
MKKFSKLFLSCAAVAAVTAAVATSAMAAGISATYAPADATHETATLTIDASGYTAAQKTLLVLKPGKTLETVKVSEGDVLQIDQQDGNDTITVALPKDLADGKYTVYMGGDGQVYSTNFKVGNASSVLVGDVNQDTKINLSDATGVVQHAMKVKAITDADALIAADANDDSKINLLDATCIVKYSVKMTDGIGNVGQLK